LTTKKWQQHANESVTKQALQLMQEGHITKHEYLQLLQVLRRHAPPCVHDKQLTETGCQFVLCLYIYCIYLSEYRSCVWRYHCCCVKNENGCSMALGTSGIVLVCTCTVQIPFCLPRVHLRCCWCCCCCCWFAPPPSLSILQVERRFPAIPARNGHGESCRCTCWQ
jgi:hypothetical protein